MKKQNPSEPLKPMLEAVRDLNCDNRLQSQAVLFLETDFSRLVTEQDFMEAFNGLAACQRILGPISEGYRKTLVDMRGTLDSLVKARNQIVPDEWLQITKETLDKLLAHLKSHLSIEAWNKAGSIVKGLFDQLTEGVRKSF